VNQYVSFLEAPMHQLLTAYREKPSTFGDDFRIPESGNGLPDQLDELKVELDWLRKMQPSDLGGGVLLKLGNVDYGDPIPEKSRLQRFYYPEPCSSASVTAAGIYHTWFRDGDLDYDSSKTSRLGPPPGYVPGGPNKSYCAGQDAKAHKCASSRLEKQPAQKAYLDFNTLWDPATEHDRSWEVTEPAIYYQAAYIKLLSKFVD